MLRIFPLLTALAIGPGGSSTAALIDREDAQLIDAVATSVRTYTQFTIFDDVDVEVADGIVTLTGRVTLPHKRDDIAARVSAVPGVRRVHNTIMALPASANDDALRSRIARAIYGHPQFWSYALGPHPPIHIVVEHGHVTLTGVVATHTDRLMARSLAHRFPAMSVTNRLRTSAEVREQREHSR